MMNAEERVQSIKETFERALDDGEEQNPWVGVHDRVTLRACLVHEFITHPEDIQWFDENGHAHALDFVAKQHKEAAQTARDTMLEQVIRKVAQAEVEAGGRYDRNDLPAILARTLDIMYPDPVSVHASPRGPGRG